MNEPLAFMNGRLVPQAQASLALNDAGFIFGATVTDLCRTFRHRLFRWDDHLTRFQQSCRAATIGLALSGEEMTTWAHELVAHNAGLIDTNADLALVLFATPGPVGFYSGQGTVSGERPTLGMHTFPLPFAHYRPWIERGVHLQTPKVRAVPAECVDPHTKHRSRMHWWLAQKQTDGADQALLLDMNGHVTETASANFLLVEGDTIVSPPRHSVLDGVSLKVMAELCGRLGIPMMERNITLDECYAADEALLTCTSYCLAGVGQLNNHVITRPGPMLKRLVAAWSEMVGMDVHGQILTG